MSGHDSLMEYLRDGGYRLTPQRSMILSAICESPGHLSAEEVYDRVRQHYPYMDISTVYRTLQLLKRLHLITETDLGDGSVRYELAARQRHHHLVCRQCGNTTSLEHDFLEPLQATLRQRYGFDADMDHLAIFGVCAACSQQG